MKNLIIAFLLFISMPVSAQIKSADLTASGLTCSMCSKAIYKALSNVPFIGTVTADIEKSSYAITFKPGSKVVLDDVKKAVTDAGFTVAALKVTAAFEKTEVYNDAHIDLGGSTFHFINVPKQTISGDKTFTVVDKNFLPAAGHKKYGKFTTMKCYETGYMGACCPHNVAAKTRIYHVTL